MRLLRTYTLYLLVSLLFCPCLTATGAETTADVSVDVESESVNAAVSVDKVVSEEPKPKVKPSLEIHAVNDVWLSVSFGGGQPVFRRTLRRGESLRWDLNAQARVVIGRPTAAQIILNGQRNAQKLTCTTLTEHTA